MGLDHIPGICNRLSIPTLTILNIIFRGRSIITTKATRCRPSSTHGKTPPEIVRVKVKSLLLIATYSTMILGMPIVLGFCRRLGTRDSPGRETDLLVAAIWAVFVVATLKSIADVTQVAQLGRYYLPIFALMLPVGVAGLADWVRSLHCVKRVAPWLAVVSCALVVGGPDLGLRRVVAGQALSAPLASLARGRPMGPGSSRASLASGSDHDVVPLGVAGHE